MSLGWQTESALLPSKAKPINVDSKSMMSLKAVVYDQEQRLNNNCISRNSSHRSNRGKYENILSSNKLTDSLLKKNIGVDSRSSKDKSQNKTGRKEDKVTATLKAKAELYDKIANGQLNTCSESFLINFQAKQNPNISNSNESIREECPEENSISHNQTTDKIVDYEKHNNSIQTNDDNRPDWSWSNGTTDYSQDEYLNNYNNGNVSKQTRDMIDANINKEILKSSESRVKSQWEKTLKGDTKEFLELIHKQTFNERFANGYSTTSENNNNDSKLDVTQKSRKDDRLELLRLKRAKLLQENA